MTISCEVLEEVTESFVGKRGPQTVPNESSLPYADGGGNGGKRKIKKRACT